MGSHSRMAMSGILPDETCEPHYQLVKKREVRCAIFGFNAKRTKIVHKEDLPKTEDFAADWEAFKEKLPAKDAIYAVYDFEHKDIQSGYNDGDLETAPIKSKMALFSWAPDNAKPQVKMLVPSSLAGIKQVCDAAQCQVQLNTMDDAIYETICGKMGIKVAKCPMLRISLLQFVLDLILVWVQVQ